LRSFFYIWSIIAEKRIKILPRVLSKKTRVFTMNFLRTASWLVYQYRQKSTTTMLAKGIKMRRQVIASLCAIRLMLAHRSLGCVLAVISIVSATSAFAQEDQTTQSWLARHFEQRIYLGLYDSFGDEKANVVQAGYDAVLRLLDIAPAWNLFDFSLGLNVWFVRDQIDSQTSAWYGSPRTRENRNIPAFELNWAMRLYFLPIKKIKTALYLEAAPITLVVYTKPYPDDRISPGKGTHVNIGTHIGFGFKSQINDTADLFTTLRLFSHTSNGRREETNPGLDMVGLIIGLQF